MTTYWPRLEDCPLVRADLDAPATCCACEHGEEYAEGDRDRGRGCELLRDPSMAERLLAIRYGEDDDEEVES